MRLNEVLQWIGAAFIIAGHVLNAAGVDGWNILAFTLGTIAFLLWTIRVANKPQMVVNVVAISIGLAGIFKAWG